ncbi:hypothetical protein IEQ44_02305 [Nocardioides sp. Y6]|uniref:Endonuclease/exonuclease/phosphatase domain-containing protein n=1 Tax=Nocardioides malaquae TaxID=2773426 RepID=A0ABR9RPI5_9ACTN|nr:endonuclease/exonuclease/phosphatase family protein [Nocardioides malaquae]MBE7323485.1 hypothetical protein [Nocardioides malaquae]
MKPSLRRTARPRPVLRLTAAAAVVTGLALVAASVAHPAGEGARATLAAAPVAAAEPTVVPTPAPTSEPVPEVPGEEPGLGSVRLVQANIKTGMAVRKFNADVATVMAEQPDFITYNEVHHRSDDLVVPPTSGYSMWRDTSNRYRAETPVAWRTDRWTPVAQGTQMLTNWRGVPKGKKVELGRRFANWVTLTAADGRAVSVVSVHLAPPTRGMPELRRLGVERLVTLVSTLSAQGPVLVGGDFNFHYGAAAYPADLFDAAQLEPTFKTLGTVFPTGDKRGATIDFIFNHGAGQLTATSHHPLELHSDHDAVVADLAWTVDAPVAAPEVITSNPYGTGAERRRAARELRRTVLAAQPGGMVEVFAADLRHAALFRSLRDAATRGVAVHFVTRTNRLTGREKKLRKHLRAATTPVGSSFARCRTACKAAWRSNGAPQGTMLVTEPGQVEPSLRLDVDRRLNANLFKQPTTVVRHTGPLAIAEAVQSMPRRRNR